MGMKLAAGRRVHVLAAILMTGVWPTYAGANPAAAEAEAAGSGELQVPDTVAGRRLTALLQAFNKGDAATLESFVAESFDGAERDPSLASAPASDLHRFFGITGGLAVRAIERSGPAEIHALVQAAETGAWYRMPVFTTAAPPRFVDPAPPYKIVGFGFESIAAPAAFAESGLSDQDVRARLDRLMGFLVRRDQFAGVVTVSKGGKPIYARAFGVADTESGTPNTLETRFHLASITKMFTAVAVGQLVEAGKLSLSDRVGTLLPELAHTELGRTVTVHHLLSHTSGLVGAREALEKGFEPPRTARTIPEMMEAVVRSPLVSRAGQQFGYSNGGYVLLGAIIERVSGETYHHYVQHHIFDAAGMDSTGFYALDARPPGIATGYKDGPQGSRLPNADDLGVIGSPATMAFATAGDLARFASALLEGRLLRKDLLKQFWTGVTEQPDHVEYGYGASLERYRGNPIVWHGGGAPGVTNRFEIHPDQDVTIVVLSNLDIEPAIIANKLREWLSSPDSRFDGPSVPPALDVAVRLPDARLMAGVEAPFELVVSNAGGAAHAVIADFEIKDEGGAKVEQQFVGDQRIEASQQRVYRFLWTPKAKGRFRIDAGIFAAGWASQLKFVEGIATVQVE